MTTDVLISFDTTGSMSPCIAEVRRRIDEALDKLFGAIPDLRIALLAHGDYCDAGSTYDLTCTEFYSQERQKYLKEFIKSTPNTNGGDSDECYELVLRNAQLFDWRDGNRILVMIGDAKPHEPGYRYGGTVFNIDWRSEVAGLAEKKINVYSVQAMGSYHSKAFYETIAHATNGRKLDLSQFSDAVETIIAISYHAVGRIEEYKQELEEGFRMNRNLARMMAQLDSKIVVDTKYTSSDRSGLIPVPPSRFQMVHVDFNTDIKSFVLSIGAPFRKGRGFYQFTKSELIQEHKEVILRNKITGDMFTGSEARNFIGLPFGERGTIRPKYFDEYEVYVQSTSANRKLIGGTKFLYENEV